jgi:iron-sulfur cluster assembly protein
MSLNRSSAPRTDPSEHIPVLAANAQDEQGSVRLTKKAIEMAKSALQKRGTPGASLRLGVRGGGCSGVSYAIEFSDKVRERDHKLDFDGLQVVVDPKSLVYLRGSVLDYEVKLMQHGFRFLNPNEKAGCGCGESFSI